MAGLGSVHYAVIDAFTDKPFRGNPAAVCLLDENKDTQWMQNVAAEFNLSDTAFLTRRRRNSHQNENVEEFDLRWFTPLAEVDLCGHATLASAHYLFSGFVNCSLVLFHTRSGILSALKIEGFSKEDQSFGKKEEKFAIELNFPQVAVFDCDSSDIPYLSNSLEGLAVHSVKKTTSNDLIIELASGEQVASLQPQFEEIQKCSGRGIIITGLAPNQSGFDFYTRFFCPKLGVNEDPVCGSAHCALAPYWAKKLGKNQLVAYQASKRGGKLVLQVVEDEKRVILQGEAIKVMSGILSA
uniref:TSA: Wollemia nobilis Ref_Wollemi_Transcript_7883_1072 transcribed RNA sequence n=1 Tax=Wollemia nobilis TaxID=56998 RepID=A0A0C9S9F5_9CONI